MLKVKKKRERGGSGDITSSLVSQNKTDSFERKIIILVCETTQKREQLTFFKNHLRICVSKSFFQANCF